MSTAKKQAFDYIEKIKETFPKYIAIRIRNGYIGKPLDKSNKNFQTERGKPYGTLVAIKGKDNTVHVGFSYLKPNEKDIPIVGVAQALKKAVKFYLSDITIDYKQLKNKNDRDLANFFVTRALCYFWPEEYSYSRGKNKIVYKNYEKIHRNREAILKFLREVKD